MRTTTQHIRLLTVVILLSGLSIGSLLGAKKGNADAGAEHATKGIALVQQKQGTDAAAAEFTEAIQAIPENPTLYAIAARRYLSSRYGDCNDRPGQLPNEKSQQALADSSKAIESGN